MTNASLLQFLRRVNLAHTALAGPQASQTSQSRAFGIGVWGWVLGCAVSCAGGSPEAAAPEAPEAAPDVEERSSAETESKASPARVSEPQSAVMEGESFSADDAQPSSAPESAKRDRAEAPAAGAAPPAPARSASKAKSAEQAAYTWSDVVLAFTQLDQADARFKSALQLSAPDCPAAESFRRAVCDLAERVCQLESELPSSTRQALCPDARERCSAASSRYRETCS